MKIVLFTALLYGSLFSLETSDRLFECTQIFKERKSELLVELERIDEQKQALSALQIATEELLKQKEAKLALQEEAVNENLEKISIKEQNVKDILAKNEEILQKLNDTKMSKIAQTFAKMKPAAAAGILSDMEAEDASMILESLKPKVVGQILTKMDAKKASELTQLLSK